MTEDVLAAGESLPLFFYEQLEAAQERQHDALSQEVAAYVVNLLATYVRRTDSAGRTSAPFATQYLRACEHGTTALRDVGDRALFVVGMLPSSFGRSVVSPTYVSAIGQGAYRKIHEERPSLAVFGELAGEFGHVVELLHEIAPPSASDAVGGLLGIYERWKKDGSRQDAKRLAAAGVQLNQKNNLVH